MISRSLCCVIKELLCGPTVYVYTIEYQNQPVSRKIYIIHKRKHYIYIYTHYFFYKFMYMSMNRYYIKHLLGYLTLKILRMLTATGDALSLKSCYQNSDPDRANQSRNK